MQSICQKSVLYEWPQDTIRRDSNKLADRPQPPSQGNVKADGNLPRSPGFGFCQG